MKRLKHMTKALTVLIFCSIAASNVLGEGVNYAHGLESSLGQLCKLAQTVVSGHLVGVETNQDEEIIVRVTGCSNVLGAPISADSAFVVGKWVDVEEIRPGQSALVFVSPTRFDAFNSDVFRFDHQIAQPLAPSVYVVGGTRGVVQGDDATLAAVRTASAGYWPFFRTMPRDTVAYASFLSGLTTSGVERVRTDAERDLRLLVRFADIPALQQIQQVIPPDTETRSYFDAMFRWKEKGMPVSVRDWTPAEADWELWMSALASSATVDRIHALAEMLRPERREAVNGAVTRWRDKVLPLLHDSDEGVRLSSALLLSGASDKRAWPVLVDGLQSDQVYWRRDVWKEVQRASGGACPAFDPTALPAEREQSITRLKDWIKSRAE